MSSDSRPRWLRCASTFSNSASASARRPTLASASMYQKVQTRKALRGLPKSSGLDVAHDEAVAQQCCSDDRERGEEARIGRLPAGRAPAAAAGGRIDRRAIQASPRSSRSGVGRAPQDLVRAMARRGRATSLRHRRRRRRRAIMPELVERRPAHRRRERVHARAAAEFPQTGIGGQCQPRRRLADRSQPLIQSRSPRRGSRSSKNICAAARTIEP